MFASMADWIVWGLFAGYFIAGIVYLAVTSEERSDGRK
jgi:hypothetical protein